MTLLRVLSTDFDYSYRWMGRASRKEYK